MTSWWSGLMARRPKIPPTPALPAPVPALSPFRTRAPLRGSVSPALGLLQPFNPPPRRRKLRRCRRRPTPRSRFDGSSSCGFVSPIPARSERGAQFFALLHPAFAHVPPSTISSLLHPAAAASPSSSTLTVGGPFVGLQIWTTE